MKFTTVFAVIVTVATAVSATLTTTQHARDMVIDTNAKRFALGLTPLSPRKISHGSPTYGAPKGKPSGVSHSCNNGPVQCCNSLENATPAVSHTFKEAFGLVLSAGVAYAMNCAPLTTLGLSHASCSSQTVCCENNSFKGLIAVGCTPINVNLI